LLAEGDGIGGAVGDGQQREGGLGAPVIIAGRSALRGGQHPIVPWHRVERIVGGGGEALVRGAGHVSAASGTHEDLDGGGLPAGTSCPDPWLLDVGQDLEEGAPRLGR